MLRLPVETGHSESVYFEVEKENVTVADIHEVLQKAPGIVVKDNPEEQLYPMPIDAVGQERSISSEESVKILMKIRDSTVGSYPTTS